MLPASTLAHLQWPSVAEEVLRRVVSPATRHRVFGDDERLDVDAVLPRSLDPQVVERWLGRLAGLAACLRRATDLPEARVSVAGELSHVEDTSGLLQRAQRGSMLDVGELAAVADAVVAAGRVAGMIAAVREAGFEPGARDEGVAFETFAADMVELPPPPELAELLERSLDRGSGEPSLSDSASPNLGPLRARASSSRRALIDSAERLLRRPGMERALADRYWTERDGRLVLPVRSDSFSRVGAGGGSVSGIIHGSSGSGQTLFVEPGELVDLGNAQRQAVMAVQDEERRILTRLSRQVGEAAEVLEASLRALVRLDLLHAKWRLARDLEATTPTVAAAEHRQRCWVPQARHPLMVLAGVDVVPNDLDLRLGQALVISGPNAGGKTVALKTLGLCGLMVQAGLPLPCAEGAVMPLFGSIVTDVGDDQSIAANLSTFSAHIGHVLDAFAASEADHTGVLVLLDEVAVGTDPDQGAALAEAILLELVERGATAVVTTHYERLKLLAPVDDRFLNASVGFDVEQLRPTFRLTLGSPGSSSALAVARRLGVPPVVLDRAEAMLESSRVRLDTLLQEVEAERERLRVEAEELTAWRRQLEVQAAALQARQQKDEASAEAKRKKAHDAATAALRALEEDLKTRRKQLRKQEPARDAAGVTDADARGFARDARSRIAAERAADPAPAVPSPPRVEPGQRVKVAALGTEGEVVAVKGDKVTVQLPLAKVTVTLDELALPEPSKKVRAKVARAFVPIPSDAARHFGAEPVPVESRVENVIDLRGARADEALAMLEVFLDRAISDDQDVVLIRHGHGSGALRKAIRDHLPTLAHVHRQRPGLSAEGGDGVTVAWIRY